MNNYTDKNIIILTNTLKSGGAEKQSALLAKSLSQDFGVVLVVYYGEQFDEKVISICRNTSIEVLQLSGNHLKKVITIYRLFKKYKESIFVSYLFTTNVVNAIIGFVAGTQKRIGGIRSSKIPFIKRKMQMILHNCFFDYTVVNSIRGMEYCIGNGFNEQKLRFITNAIEVKQLPKLNLQDFQLQSEFKIVTVARFVESKDFKTALVAIKLLIDDNETSRNFVHYNIIGYGDLEMQIRSWIKELDLSNYVTIIINPTDIGLYLSSANVYLSSSIYEGTSNSILEAMEYSMPIVGTDCGDTKELVKDQINGFVCKVGDSNSIYNALKKLMTNDSLRFRFGTESYMLLRQNYSTNSLYKNFVSLIADEK